MRSYLRQPVIASPVIQQPENLSGLMQQLAEKPLLRSLIPHILYVHTPARTPTPTPLYVRTPTCLHLAPSPPHPPQDASTHVLNEGAIVLHDEGAVLLGHNVKVHQHTLPLSPHSTPLHLLLCDKKQGIGCSTDTHLYAFRMPSPLLPHQRSLLPSSSPPPLTFAATTLPVGWCLMR